MDNWWPCVFPASKRRWMGRSSTPQHVIKTVVLFWGLVLVMLIWSSMDGVSGLDEYVSSFEL